MANYKCDDCNATANSVVELIECPRCGSFKIFDLSYRDENEYDDFFVEDSEYDSDY